MPTNLEDIAKRVGELMQAAQLDGSPVPTANPGMPDIVQAVSSQQAFVAATAQLECQLNAQRRAMRQLQGLPVPAPEPCMPYSPDPGAASMAPNLPPAIERTILLKEMDDRLASLNREIGRGLFG